MLKKNFNIEKIDKNEVFRYLGRKDQEVSEDLIKLTDSVIEETLSLARPMAVYEKGELSKNNDSLNLLNITLKGEAIKDLLRESEDAYIFAVTLGLQIDNKIKQYEITDITRALIMDACASALTEEVCDALNEEIESLENAEGKFTTERFSPGYSDMPLSTQPLILESLDTSRKIGLFSSDTFLLYPRKSVTAIIGVLDSPREPRGLICKDCILRGNCKFGICRRKI